MSIDKVVQTIISLNPQAAFNTGDGNDLDTCTITWNDGTSEISKADIQAEMDRLQVEYDAQDYARKRKPEYPSIEECVHAILDDTLTELQTKRADIKVKHPKSDS